MVRGVDAIGEIFEINNALDSLSAYGLYVWLERRIEPAIKLSTIPHISISPPEVDALPPVARLLAGHPLGLYLELPAAVFLAKPYLPTYGSPAVEAGIAPAAHRLSSQVYAGEIGEDGYAMPEVSH
jgi:hypothetical protein